MVLLVPVELDDPWRPEPLRSTETERLRATASEPSLPRLARLSPPRTAPSRSSQQPRQPRRPLPQQGPPLDAAAPGDMTLQEWMQAISAPQGAIGMQVRRAELPGRPPLRRALLGLASSCKAPVGAPEGFKALVAPLERVATLLAQD